jgi:hypothetical protein
MQSEEAFQNRRRQYAQHADRFLLCMRFVSFAMALAVGIFWIVGIVGDGDYLFLAVAASIAAMCFYFFETLLRSHTDMILAIYEQNHEIARQLNKKENA